MFLYLLIECNFSLDVSKPHFKICHFVHYFTKSEIKYLGHFL
jgi:hypothetical protein